MMKLMITYQVNFMQKFMAEMKISLLNLLSPNLPKQSLYKKTMMANKIIILNVLFCFTPFIPINYLRVFIFYA